MSRPSGDPTRWSGPPSSSRRAKAGEQPRSASANGRALALWAGSVDADRVPREAVLDGQVDGGPEILQLAPGAAALDGALSASAWVAPAGGLAVLAGAEPRVRLPRLPDARGDVSGARQRCRRRPGFARPTSRATRARAGRAPRGARTPPRYSPVSGSSTPRLASRYRDSASATVTSRAGRPFRTRRSPSPRWRRCPCSPGAASRTFRSFSCDPGLRQGRCQG